MYMTVYADTTDLFTEDELEETGCNLVDLDIPDNIVRAYYEQHKEDCDADTNNDLGVPLDQCTFEQWQEEVYTADGTMELYYFAIEHGYIPPRREDFTYDFWGWHEIEK